MLQVYLLSPAVLLSQQDKARPPHEPDTDLGHAEWPPSHAHNHPAGASTSEGGAQNAVHASALERMREAAAHAVEGVRMRLHLGAAGEPTAEQRTGGCNGSRPWQGCCGTA